MKIREQELGELIGKANNLDEPIRTIILTLVDLLVETRQAVRQLPATPIDAPMEEKCCKNIGGNGHWIDCPVYGQSRNPRHSVEEIKLPEELPEFAVANGQEKTPEFWNRLRINEIIRYLRAHK